MLCQFSLMIEMHMTIHHIVSVHSNSQCICQATASATNPEMWLDCRLGTLARICAGSKPVTSSPGRASACPCLTARDANGQCALQSPRY
jgi:hypothetical protein